MKRPSTHELSGKLKAASAAASGGHVALVEPTPILTDLIDLRIPGEELRKVVQAILSEIRPEHYQGKKPPEASYEKRIQGLELYAFKWPSSRLRCKVYFKFALKGDILWIVSLHKDRS